MVDMNNFMDELMVDTALRHPIIQDIIYKNVLMGVFFGQLVGPENEYKMYPAEDLMQDGVEYGGVSHLITDLIQGHVNEFATVMADTTTPLFQMISVGLTDDDWADWSTGVVGVLEDPQFTQEAAVPFASYYAAVADGRIPATGLQRKFATLAIYKEEAGLV